MLIKRYKDFIVETKEDSNLWTYDGNFVVEEYMILDDKFIKDKIPDIINGSFDCRYKYLTSLEGGPKEVKGSFDCSGNEITSLKGSPEIIGKYFDCTFNRLTSLIGAPVKIGEDFYCNDNYLTSLEGSPKMKIYANYQNLKIEQKFINSGSYKDNYWMDLLKYMIDKEIDLQEVHGWPEGFLTDEVIKSFKGINKFNI